MSWTTPRTWPVGEAQTAALFNTNIRDQFSFLGGTDGLGTSMTPPASPVTGQRWWFYNGFDYIPAVYRVDLDSTYPWFPLSNVFTPLMTTGGGTSTVQTFAALGSYTTPRAGYYRFMLTGAGSTNTGANAPTPMMSLYIGGSQVDATSGGPGSTMSGPWPLVIEYWSSALAAGTSVQVMIACGGATGTQTASFTGVDLSYTLRRFA